MLIFLLFFLFISFPNTNAQTLSNGGMEKSDFIPLLITILFLGLVIWDGIYKEWIKNKIKEKERIFKISFFSMAGIILFSLGIPIWKRLILNLLHDELAFFPFMFTSIIFSTALLISFMDRRVYAAFFCCTCIILIAINFYDEVAGWDMFPLALLFYCLSSFAPACFFHMIYLNNLIKY